MDRLVELGGEQRWFGGLNSRVFCQRLSWQNNRVHGADVPGSRGSNRLLRLGFIAGLRGFAPRGGRGVFRFRKASAPASTTTAAPPAFLALPALIRGRRPLRGRPAGSVGGNLRLSAFHLRFAGHSAAAAGRLGGSRPRPRSRSRPRCSRGSRAGRSSPVTRSKSSCSSRKSET